MNSIQHFKNGELIFGMTTGWGRQGRRLSVYRWTTCVEAKQPIWAVSCIKSDYQIIFPFLIFVAISLSCFKLFCLSHTLNIILQHTFCGPAAKEER